MCVGWGKGPYVEPSRGTVFNVATAAPSPPPSSPGRPADLSNKTRYLCANKVAIFLQPGYLSWLIMRYLSQRTRQDQTGPTEYHHGHSLQLAACMLPNIGTAHQYQLPWPPSLSFSPPGIGIGNFFGPPSIHPLAHLYPIPFIAIFAATVWPDPFPFACIPQHTPLQVWIQRLPRPIYGVVATLLWPCSTRLLELVPTVCSYLTLEPRQELSCVCHGNCLLHTPF